MLGLSLLLFLVVPAAPADDGLKTASPDPPPIAEKLELLEKRLSERCGRMEAALAEIGRLDAAFPTAADPEDLLRRRQVILDRFDVLNADEDGLHSTRQHLLDSYRIVAFSSGLSGAMKGRRADADAGKRLLVIGRNAQEEDSRRDRIAENIRSLEGAFRPVRDAYLARRAKRRREAYLGAAAIILLCCAAIPAYLIRRPTPSPPPAATAAQDPLPALVAQNFSVVGLLGRGSMGEVYEAIDKSLNRRTALKRLRAELLQDPAELENLLKEARIMAGLKHPNLMSIYSVAKDADQVYLVLEFVDGASLRRTLEARCRLGWAEALRIARAVGAALDYAHERKVIHRDLKPANIMLSAKGEVKVMDFGIAYQSAKSVSRLTRAPTWGTPPYMAPEQELGGVSAAVDIYALSVCLYEMLTGELPFKGPNFLAQKREALWVPPSRLVAGLPARVDALFAAALAPEPSRRFKTAGALMAACDALNS